MCDFGLAQALDTLQETRASAFTVAYAAPEVVALRKPSSNTDQYCLAISYYELRTGELPFQSKSVKGVLEEKQQGDLDLSRLHPAERHVLAKAAALLPDARYSSCSEMVEALRSAVEKEDRIATVAPLSQDRKLTWGRLLIAATLFLAIIALLFWYAGSSDQRGFQLALRQYTNRGALFDSSLATVCETLESLPHDGTYQQAAAELNKAWGSLAENEDRDLNDEARVAQALAFVRGQAEAGQAASLRSNILEYLAGRAVADLKEDRVDEASLKFEKLDAYLNDTPEDAVPSLRQTVRLGIARTTARRDPSDSASLRANLLQLADLADLQRPNLADFSPDNRAAALAMLAILARDRGYKQLVPRLYDLVYPHDLQSAMTDWERSQIDALRKQTLRQVEKQSFLAEPWKQMVQKVWPPTPVEH